MRVFFLIVVAVLIAALGGLEMVSSRAVNIDGQPVDSIEMPTPPPAYWR